MSAVKMRLLCKQFRNIDTKNVNGKDTGNVNSLDTGYG